MLLMVVMAPVHEDPAYTEELFELLEAGETLRALRHGKPWKHLVSGPVASSLHSIRLPSEANREASFSVYKTDHPTTELNQSFLLIFRTRHVVTMVNVRSDVTR